MLNGIQARVLGMIRGNHMPLSAPVEEIHSLWSEPEKNTVDEMLRYSFVGGPIMVKNGLQSFLDRTPVDEIMAVSHIYEHAARLRSYEILSNLDK